MGFTFATAISLPPSGAVLAFLVKNVSPVFTVQKRNQFSSKSRLGLSVRLGLTVAVVVIDVTVSVVVAVTVTSVGAAVSVMVMTTAVGVVGVRPMQVQAWVNSSALSLSTVREARHEGGRVRHARLAFLLLLWRKTSSTPTLFFCSPSSWVVTVVHTVSVSSAIHSLVVLFAREEKEKNKNMVSGYHVLGVKGTYTVGVMMTVLVFVRAEISSVRT